MMKRLVGLITVLVMFIGAPGVFTKAATVEPDQILVANTEVQINKANATVYVGNTITLRLNNATGTVKWSSSDTSVASVSAKGMVTGLSAGTATISATYKSEKYKCVVTVKNPTINKKKLTLTVGETAKLKLNGATIESCKSKNKKVAKVSSTGKVTAVGAGTVYIVITDTNENTYKCKVTVKAASELTAKEIYQKCSDSVVQVNAGNALGSGFFIDDYTVVTNYHVIDLATELSVSLMNGDEYKVTHVLGYSPEYDIAILKVKCKGVPFAKNTHVPEMGDTTYTIGSSLGMTNTFTNGIITNLSRKIDGVDYYQTNTAISHGNSGGPLINGYGEVIGITSAYYENGQNLNLAINLKQLDKVDTSYPMTSADFIASFDSLSRLTDFVYNYGEYNEEYNWIAISETENFDGIDFTYMLTYYLDDGSFSLFGIDEYASAFIKYDEEYGCYVVTCTAFYNGEEIGYVMLDLYPGTFDGKFDMNNIWKVDAYEEDVPYIVEEAEISFNILLDWLADFLDTYDTGATMSGLGF